MLTRIQLLVASLNIFIQHEDEQSYQEQNQLAHGVTNDGPVVSHDIVVDEGTRQGKKPVYCKDKWLLLQCSLSLTSQEDDHSSQCSPPLTLLENDREIPGEIQPRLHGCDQDAELVIRKEEENKS